MVNFIFRKDSYIDISNMIRGHNIYTIRASQIEPHINHSYEKITLLMYECVYVCVHMSRYLVHVLISIVECNSNTGIRRLKVNAVISGYCMAFDLEVYLRYFLVIHTKCSKYRVECIPT